MAEADQILKALKNRVKGMIEEAKMRQRHGNRQQLEELEHLVDMLEQRIES
jgi:vacuolar-type H+-ATPase subunit E/Vma4